MEKMYQTKRVLADGTVKVYSYPRMTKGNPHRGAQKTTKTKIVEKLRDLSPDDLMTVLNYVHELSQATTESEDPAD